MKRVLSMESKASGISSDLGKFILGYFTNFISKKMLLIALFLEVIKLHDNRTAMAVDGPLNELYNFGVRAFSVRNMIKKVAIIGGGVIGGGWATGFC